MNYRKEISDQIIERAVELWCRALKAPIYDNGDESWRGAFGMGLARENAARDREGIDYPQAIEKFREALTRNLKFCRDHDGEPIPEDQLKNDGSIEHRSYRLDTFLNCDYGPCLTLSNAAEEVGVPASAFSYKSTVSMSKECVSASFGYAGEYVYHYPMPDGRWLITTLTGAEIDKVIAGVLDGRLSEFTVEAA